MAKDPTTDTGAPKRTRKPRKAGVARPIFMVLQYVDDAGNPIPFNKAQLKIVSVHRNADAVLAATEDNRDSHMFFIRGMLPAPTAKEAASE